jgi:nucleotide sugar dehydrogenase
MRIGVIGANTLGVAFSLLCERAGYDVMIYDENEDIIVNLNQEIYNTTEPLIQKMLFESHDFSGTTDVVELIKRCDTIFTFVDTIPTIDGGNDTTKVFEVSNHFFTTSQLDIPIYNKKFIIGSTMNPGETEQIQEKLHMFNIQVGYCPTMSSEGNIINGYYNSDIIIIGTEHQELSNQLINLFSKIQPNGVNVHTMSFKAAEISKLSINTYLSMKISFANMLGDLFVKSGLKEESRVILNTIGSDSRIGSKSFKYGFGYGGLSLPRDSKTLTEFIKKYEIDDTLILSIKDSNENHSKFLKEYYISQNSDKGIPFVMEYVTFKKGTNNLINSQQWNLCLELLNEGYYVNIIDNNQLGSQLHDISIFYNNRLKFYKSDTTPEGYKINL